MNCLQFVDSPNKSSNGLWIAEVGDFEIQMFSLCTMLNSSNKVQLTHVCPNFGNAMLAVAFFCQTYKTKQK